QPSVCISTGLTPSTSLPNRGPLSGAFFFRSIGCLIASFAGVPLRAVATSSGLSERPKCCKAGCRNAAHKRPKKRRLTLERVDIPRSVAKGPFSARKSVCCKDPYTLEIGPSVRAQILAQKDQPNPISFTTPDGIKARVWLGVGAPCVQGKGG